MSRVFDALRSAEQAAKAKAAAQLTGAKLPLELGSTTPGGEAGLAVALKELEALRQELSTWVARLETSRSALEGLIADALRLRREWESELGSWQAKFREASLAELRAAGSRIRVELGRDMESLIQASLEKAGKRLEEEVAKTVAGLGQTARSTMDDLASEGSQHFRGQLETTLRTLEGDAAERLQTKARDLLGSAAESIQVSHDQSLAKFSETLAASGHRLVRETTRQLEETRVAAQRMTYETKRIVDECLSESRERIRGLRESAVEDLKTDLRQDLARERESALRQLRNQADSVGQEVEASIRTSSRQVTKESCETVQRQVGQATVVLKDWQDRAQEKIEAEFQKSLEGFGNQLTELAGNLLEEHRRKLGFLVSGLHGCLKKAAEALTDVGTRLPGVEDRGESANPAFRP